MTSPEAEATQRRVLTAGDRALLVELPDLDGALAYFDALTLAELAGVTEVVPAARTVLVRFDPLLVSVGDLAAELAGLEVSEAAAGEGKVVEIGVHYNGEDLAEVADLLGLTEQQVIDAHTGTEYRVAFGGFAPGFAYLSDGDPVLDVPRRSSPRTRIPPGAVALAGTFSAVYPRESPGGWQIIGQTDLVMWDLEHDPPATLQPGDRARFFEAPPVEPVETQTSTSSVDDQPAEPVETPSPNEPVEATASVSSTSDEPSSQPTPGAPTIEIISPGALALIQDDGRPGLAGLGVAASGALDRRSLHTANRLVGNRVNAAAIEFSFGGKIRAHGDVVVAAAGEELELTITRADERVVPVLGQHPVWLQEGDSLAIMPIQGARAYLAVRGGFDVPEVLGSRCTDTMSRIGPDVLMPGATLGIGSVPAGDLVADSAPWPGRLTDDVVELPLLLGPREDWFTPEALDLLFEQVWTVTPRSDRVGLRLKGEQPLTRAVDGELPSEGAVAGALQIPAEGQPVLFLSDHPVTGGYPVVAVLHSSALDTAGQLRPNAKVRFTKA